MFRRRKAALTRRRRKLSPGTSFDWTCTSIVLGTICIAIAANPSTANELVLDGGGPPVRAEIVFEGWGEQLTVKGSDLANVITELSETETPIIYFELNDTDAAAFSDMTARMIGIGLAVSICGMEVSRPIVRDRLSGRGQIPIDDPALAVALVDALTGQAPCPNAKK